MERRWTVHFWPRNWTTEKFEFVLRFPKNILHMHNSFVSSIALAFLYSSSRRVNNFGNH
jgi:hypothetical protein